jgi:Icc-related predicted phosphoesterase
MSFFISLWSKPESPFEPPGFLYTLFVHPVTTFFTFLHYLALGLRGSPYKPPPHAIPIRVVCISDTHSKIPPKALPKGDLLIHAGDLTNNGTLSNIQQSIDWLKTLQKPWPGSSDGFRHIVVVCGNHDSYFDDRSRSAHDKRNSGRKLNWGKIHYLQHSSVSLLFPGDRTLKVYGAPQIPKCGGKEFAFQYSRGQDAWSNTIPDDVDVLVTHNPPKWHLDIPENGGLGCEHELNEVWRVKPTLHVFGHVHAGHGKENVWWDSSQRTFEAVRSTGFGKPCIFGPVSEVLNLGLWGEGMKLVLEDARALLWKRVWGGACRGGIMVNAALTYRSTDKLSNKPQVVVL